MPNRSLLLRRFRALWLLTLAGVPLGAQSSAPAPTLARLSVVEATRVADPKLAGGNVRLAFRLQAAGTSAGAVAEVRANGALVKTLWSGTLVGGAAPTQVVWDGRDANGARCATGSYALSVHGPGLMAQQLPLDLVRLGVTEIEAQDSPAGDDEFQMVYFKKGTAYGFYATPAIHEYIDVARSGELSDLDLDDGEPRPVVMVHDGTAEPVMDGANYDTSTFNYPLAYVRGTVPRLELTFGASATAVGGAVMDVGYPLQGVELRVHCAQGTTILGADQVMPGGTALVDLGPLANDVGREDRLVTFRFQARVAGELAWREIPGAQTIPLRFYTLLDAPRFKNGATSAQYAGPWVEVAEDFASWKSTLGLPAANQHDLTNVFVHGFFGQNGGIPTPIENVKYDTVTLGGDGGATHYFNFSNSNMRLSRLLNNHALGRFVNCSDNMGAATTMLSMLGAQHMRPVRLGFMDLRALWGIGAPGYTLDLWGGSHAFSYHHIVTDDDAVSVSDTCMQLDSDGNPLALPSTIAWNVQRPWAGIGGYNDLAADNVVTKSLEQLPGLQ